MGGPDNIAVLRIELEDIEPLIWRRVAVPASMNLKALHRKAAGRQNRFAFAARP
jgi:hypothetical protein